MARTLDDWRRALQSPEALAALMKEEARAKDDLPKAQDADDEADDLKAELADEPQ